MIFVTLGDQQLHGGTINWYQSVDMPRTVYLFEGPHLDLRSDFHEAEHYARRRHVGTALRIWRSRRRKTVTYAMLHKGTWTADARRSDGGRRLILLGFAR